jgi:uncharacterized membrane protein YidH (DUF202 family)
MEGGNSFKRTLGTILAGIGLILLLIACFAFMSSDNQVLGFDLQGMKKLAPTVLGLILMVVGVSMINRS